MKKKRNMSIKAKLLGIIIPVMVAIVVVLVLVAYEMSSGIIGNYSENLLESSVDNQANEIESWLNKNIAGIKSAKKTIEQLKPDNEEMQNILDGYYGFDENYPDGIYIADSNGNLMKASESDKSESDVTGSVWYKEGLTRVNPKVGSAYKNSKGENVISASAMINDGSGNVSVISADMTLDRVAIIVNSFIEMKHAEAVLVDKNTGVIIANRDSELISQKIGDGKQSDYYKQLAKKVTAKKYDSTTLDGNMTVFKEVDGTDWLLVSYIPKSVIMSDIAHLRMVMIVISVVCILLLCVLIERVTHIVIKPVKKMTKIITQMSSGDFTVTMDVKGNDEIAVMGYSVKKFIENMKQMIKEMGMEDQCVITSVSLDYLKRVKEAEPELKTGYILAAAYGSYYKNEFVDFISIRSSLVTKKQIQAAHEYGKAIHVWTVNSRSEIEQMALMGVDNIITDYPTRAKEVLYQPDVAKNLLTYIRQVMK